MTEETIQTAYSVIDFDFNTYIVQSEDVIDSFRPSLICDGQGSNDLAWGEKHVIRHTLATMIYDAFNVAVTPVRVLEVKPLDANYFVNSVLVMDKKLPNPNKSVLEASCVLIPKGYVNGPQNYLPDCMYKSNVYVVNKGNISSQKRIDLDQILMRV